MKNLISKLFLGALVVFLASCEAEEYTDVASAEYHWVGMSLPSAAASAITIQEGNGASFNQTTITLRTGGTLSNEENITVDFEFSGDATLNDDFVIIGGSNVTASGFSVTIPSGSLTASFQVRTVTNVIEESNRAVTITMVSNSEDLAMGYPRKKAVTVTIADDDCSFDLEDDFSGTSSVTEQYSASSYGPYDPEVEYDGPNTLIIYNFWDWGWEVEATVDPDDNSVVLTSLDDSGGGLGGATGCHDWTVATVTGVLSPCTKTILLRVTVSSACFGYTSTFNYNIIFP
jgi:hypothetical protein